MIELPDLALSVRQPWAHCIMFFGKDIENRDWPTKFRGRICVHASKGMTNDEWEECLGVARHVATKRDLRGKTFPSAKSLLRGGIVGTVEIADCVQEGDPGSDSPWFFGRYGFVLRDPRPVDFIPVKGQLNFFDWRKNIIQVAA